MTPKQRPLDPVSSEAFTTQEIRQALSDILRSRQFQGAPRLCDFLTYIVEKKLAGQEQYLKEYVLGTDVLGRAADYDPRTDPIVRSHAGRLRKKLDEYYVEHGQTEIVISLPKGHYIPAFTRRAPAPPSMPLADVPPPAPELIVIEADELRSAQPAVQQNAQPSSAAIIETASASSIIAGRRWALGLIALAAIGGAALGWAGVNWLNRWQAARNAMATVIKAPDATGIAAAGQVAVAPEIDGLLDTAWTNRIAQRIEKRLKGEDALNTNFGVLWDAANLYLLIEVRDAWPNRSRARDRDQIEVYFDTKNERQRNYQAHNFQFILPARGGTATEQNNRVAGVQMAALHEAWGYRVEAAIPWTTLGATAEAGRRLGFDLTLHRRNAPEAQFVWHGTQDNWFDPSGFGTLVLTSDLVNAALTTVPPIEEAPATGVLRVAADEAHEAGVRLRFALPALPPRVLSARLRLNCAALSGQGRGYIVKVYGLPVGSRHAPSSALFQSAIVIAAPAMWYEWDVTPIVRQAVESSARQIDLTLRGRDVENSGQGWVEFASRRTAQAEPRLVLEY